MSGGAVDSCYRSAAVTPLPPSTYHTHPALRCAIMIREGTGMAVQHLQDHLTIYAALTLAFWSYVVYTFFLRVRFFSPTRQLPGPEHGHYFFGQLGTITRKAPGVAQLEWHRKVRCSTLAQVGTG